MPTAPLHLKHTETIFDFMSPKDLQRNNQRISHEVIVHPCVEDLDSPVIRRRGKQGVDGVEMKRPDGTCVIPERMGNLVQLIGAGF